MSSLRGRKISKEVTSLRTRVMKERILYFSRKEKHT